MMSINAGIKTKKGAFLEFFEAAFFSFLPWFSLFIVEFFEETPLKVVVIDKGIVRLAFCAIAIYSSIILSIALVSYFFSIPFSRIIFSRYISSGQKIAMFALASCLTPLTFLAFRIFSHALGGLPLWMTVIGIPLVWILLLVGGLTVLFGLIEQVEMRRRFALVTAAIGISSWLPLVFYFHHSHNPIKILIILASMTLAQLGLLARNFVALEKKIPFRWLSNGFAVLFLSFGLPIIINIMGDLSPPIRQPTQRTVTSISRPNVVIFLADALRADHCSIYGYSKATQKELSEEIASGWTIFKNATTQATSTISSVKALFTSQPASFRGMKGYSRPPLKREDTMPKAFLKAGYRTACISANGLVSGGGFEAGFQKFLSWSGYAIARESLALRYILSRGDTLRLFRLTRALKAHYPRGEIILDMAENWIRSLTNEPFFLYLHTCDTHWPYYDRNLGMIPEEYRAYDDKLTFVDLLSIDTPDKAQEIRNTPEFINFVARYDEGIRYTDERVHQLITFLKKTNLWENTIFILTADHGEELLDHDRFSHGHDVWEELTHIPMIIKWPKTPHFFSMPVSVDARVGLIDLFPTFVDYLELSGSKSPMKGASLRPILEQGRNGTAVRPLFSEAIFEGAIRGAYWEDHMKMRLEYSQDVSPLESTNISVYDLEHDPSEKMPIAPKNPTISEAVLRGRSYLQNIWNAWPDKGGQKAKIGPKEANKKTEQKSIIDKLKSLGYLK